MRPAAEIHFGRAYCIIICQNGAAGDPRKVSSTGGDPVDAKRVLQLTREQVGQEAKTMNGTTAGLVS